MNDDGNNEHDTATATTTEQDTSSQHSRLRIRQDPPAAAAAAADDYDEENDLENLRDFVDTAHSNDALVPNPPPVQVDATSISAMSAVNMATLAPLPSGEEMNAKNTLQSFVVSPSVAAAASASAGIASRSAHSSSSGAANKSDTTPTTPTTSTTTTATSPTATSAAVASLTKRQALDPPDQKALSKDKATATTTRKIDSASSRTDLLLPDEGGASNSNDVFTPVGARPAALEASASSAAAPLQEVFAVARLIEDGESTLTGTGSSSGQTTNAPAALVTAAAVTAASTSDSAVASDARLQLREGNEGAATVAAANANARPPSTSITALSSSTPTVTSDLTQSHLPPQPPLQSAPTIDNGSTATGDAGGGSAGNTNKCLVRVLVGLVVVLVAVVIGVVAVLLPGRQTSPGVVVVDPIRPTPAPNTNIPTVSPVSLSPMRKTNAPTMGQLTTPSPTANPIPTLGPTTNAPRPAPTTRRPTLRPQLRPTPRPAARPPTRRTSLPSNEPSVTPSSEPIRRPAPIRAPVRRPSPISSPRRKRGRGRGRRHARRALGHEAAPPSSRSSFRERRHNLIVSFIESITLSGQQIQIGAAAAERLLPESKQHATQQQSAQSRSFEARPFSSFSAEEKAVHWLIYHDPWSQLLPIYRYGQFRLSQRYALLTLWFQQQRQPTNTSTTQTTNNINNWPAAMDGWTMTPNECHWKGVICQMRYISDDVGWQTAVTELHLESHTNVAVSTMPVGMSRTSTIPADLGLLAKLQHLEWHDGNNPLAGSLPDAIGVWTDLEYLDLTNNRLTGTLPASIGQWTNLKVAKLFGNALTGPLPAASMSRWTNLQHLSIYANKLTGTMPLLKGMRRDANGADEESSSLDVFSNETFLAADCLSKVSCPICTYCHE